MRKILSLVFVVCVIGFFVSISNRSDSGAGFFFVAGLVTLIAIGLVQKIAEWLGIDNQPRQSRGVTTYFVNAARDILDSEPGSPNCSRGDSVQLNGRSYEVIDVTRDSEGDYICAVR